MAVAASQISYQLANCRGRLPVTLSMHFGAFELSVSVLVLQGLIWGKGGGGGGG